MSEGCVHCYAETMAKRVGHDVWGPQSARRQFSDKHWNEPLRWNEKAKAVKTRAFVFCASMADWLEDRPE